MTTQTTYTAEQIEAIGGNRWTRGDKDRVYISDWADMAGLHITRYNTGNVRSASLAGQDLSNRRAAILAAGKVYWEDGTLRTNLRDLAEQARVDYDEIMNPIKAAIAERVAAVQVN